MKVVVHICVLIFMFSLSSFAGNNYFWKPSSGNSSNTPANWRISTCNGTVSSVVPGSADTILFSSCNTGACTINANLSVAQINVQASYTGTISFSGGVTLTFSVGKFKGGTMTGGSGDITVNESLLIDGSAFTSTAGTLTIKGDFTYKGSSFSHNNGTVIFQKGANATTIINGVSNAATTLILYNAEFAAPSVTTQFSIRNMTIQIDHEMNITGSNQLFLNTTTSSSVEVKGNLTNSNNTEDASGGTLQLLINGTGSQSITGTGAADQGKFPNLTVNKASGTVSLYGIITMGGSTTWKYMNGTVSEGTARLICSYNNTLHNNSSGTMRFNKLTFYGRGDNHTIIGKVVVSDTLEASLTGDCIVNGDTLEAQGNIKWSNTSSSSSLSAVLKLTGSTAQIISGSVTVPLQTLIIKKTSGDITLSREVSIGNNLTLTAGYIVSTSSHLITVKHGATATGASNLSFVKGPVKKIGNSAFEFPVGKGTNYNAIGISAPTNSTDAFTAEYFNSNQGHGTSVKLSII